MEDSIDGFIKERGIDRSGDRKKGIPNHRGDIGSTISRKEKVMMR